jgi:putative intracellular protease/amidase
MQPSDINKEVAVLLYPGCIYFEIALAAEMLNQHFPVRYYFPNGQRYTASNGAVLQPAGDYVSLVQANAVAVLIPGGNPDSILTPYNIALEPLCAQAQRGALLASICAGNLVLAATGLLRGRRGTHNYTNELAPPEVVAATASFWEGMHFEQADLVQDGPFITAQPWAYRKYAAAIGRYLGVLDSAAQVAPEPL